MYTLQRHFISNLLRRKLFRCWTFLVMEVWNKIALQRTDETILYSEIFEGRGARLPIVPLKKMSISHWPHYLWPYPLAHFVRSGLNHFMFGGKYTHQCPMVSNRIHELFSKQVHSEIEGFRTISCFLFFCIYHLKTSKLL